MKDKNELDKLSYEKVQKYRVKLISVGKITEELNQYLKEMEFYIELRFKRIYVHYKKWKKQAKEGSKNEWDKFDVEGCKNLVSIGNAEFFHHLHLASDIQKIGNFQYIKGIKYKIPKKYGKKFKNFQINKK